MPILSELHCLRVPVDDAAAFDTEIAEKRGPGGAEAEGCVFDWLTAGADGVEEVVEVVVAVGVAGGGYEFFD